MMTDRPLGRRSTPSLIADALSQITALFETELRLLKTEISEKISSAINAVVVLLVAAVLLLAAVFLLLIGFVELLIAFGLIPWQAYFIVGLSIALCAGIALFIALRRLTAARMVPNRAIGQLSKDVSVVREQVL